MGQVSTTAIASLIFAHLCLCDESPRGCPAGPSSGDQYRLVTAIPAGCDPSNCDYYLGIRTNDEDPEFLDFMMVGKAQGWIAIGFSLKQEMPDADVLACAVNPDTSQVVVMDTYNVPDDHNNIPDTIQNVCPHSANFTGGRISCVFSRAINTGDPQDKDLNGDYYEQFAAVDNPAVISGGSVSLSKHKHQTPSISKEMVNPAKDSTPLDIALLPSSSSSSVGCPSGPSSGAQYRLVTAIPAGCDPSNCDYYLGIRTNDEDPEFLDFMMVGKAQGWIAIGFSLKQEMPDADVLACAVNPDTSQVVVMDTYNVPDDHNNIPDTIQNVCPHSANFTGGRISCVFSRAINTGDPQDKDLNGDYYDSLQLWTTLLSSVEAVCPSPNTSTRLLPSSSGAQYRLVTAIPAGCDPSNCDYYLGIRTNDEDPEFLDFMMVGKAQGWIAIGFSLKQEMPDADVLACAVYPDTSQVVVMDTYNVPDDHNNIPDTIQNVCPHSANFTGGRISCVFSRAINTEDPQDKDLNGDYYEQFAAVDNPAVISGGSVSLSEHTHQTPSISKEMVNPAKDSTPLDIALLPSSSSSSVSCPSGPSPGAQYRLVTAIPAGCDPSNCDYYLGIRTNDEDPEFLDFMMPDADVLACAVNPDTSQVVVMDTYNVPDDHNNIPDTIQNVCPHSANFTGGRISCVFSRAINTGDPQDKDLNGDYYEQFAAVDNPAVISGGSVSLSKHKHQTPSISKEMVNPAKDSTPLDIALLPSSSSSSSVSCPSGPSSGLSIGWTNDEDPEFLDFMMVGKAQGWIAIGFSLKQEMPDADVLACAVNSDTSQVVVMDTYNVPDDHNNIPDTIQNVCPHSANFTGGRISCVFSRAINTGDPQDKDLNGDYYEQFAAVDKPAVVAVCPSPSTNTRLLPSSPGAQYRLVTAIPAGCDPSNCDYYLGIRTNDEDPEFLDFMMVGKAQGWIAIGFSLKKEMPDADVLACAVNPDTSQVVVMDTYNVPDDHNNIPDTIQNVCPHSANFTGGRISCVFSRAINTGDPQDKDLNGDYYEQFAAVDNPAVISGGSVSLSKHKHQTPSISKEMVNPAKDSTPLDIALLPSSSSSSVSCPSGPSSGAQYRLVTAIPAGCDPSNCDYYLGIRTNDEDSEFLDFMMVGKAQGWIAIGFSLKQEMPDADVLACAVNPDTSQVVVMDTYNSGYNNIRDPMQSLCSHSAGTSNGIISCVFSRAINTGDPQDKDLNGDYYEQFAAVDNLAAIVSGNVTLTYHGSQTPLISKSTVNPATTNGSVSSSSPLRVILTRVHGILMVVAWPVLAVTGIFFAAWMKPVLRNGWWFQIHRSLMMSSVFVSSAALVLVFVANKDNPTPGLIELCNRPKAIAHFGIGCTVMVLQIINPMVALCRCAPGTLRLQGEVWKRGGLEGVKRGGVEGVKREGLEVGNTGIGASLFEDTISKAPAGNHTILWPLIAVVTFVTTLLIVLIIAVNRPGSANSIFHLLAKDKEEEKVLIGEEETVGYKPGIVKKTTLIEACG
eukprot:Em0599g4a